MACVWHAFFIAKNCPRKSGDRICVDGLCVAILFTFCAGAILPENCAEATAGAGLSDRGEQIQGEADILEALAGIAVCCICRATLRHASAKRMNHNIDCAEQLYDGKQPDGNIDRNGCAEGGISVCLRGFTATGIAGVAGVAGIAGREAQLCIERNRLALCKNEGASLGESIHILIGYGGNVCLSSGMDLCKTKKRCRIFHPTPLGILVPPECCHTIDINEGNDAGQDKTENGFHPRLYLQALACICFLDEVIPTPAEFVTAEDGKHQRAKRQDVIGNNEVPEIKPSRAFCEGLEMENAKAQCSGQRQKEDADTADDTALGTRPAGKLTNHGKDVFAYAKDG